MEKAKENLRKILEAHRIWLESGGRKGTLADLSGARLIEANLNEANLSRADLSGARLIGANLIGANLSRAKLSETRLIGANLIGANLSKANLSKANLSWAKLNEADLSGADLVNSDLRKAEISGACLDDAHTSRWNIEGIICTHLVTGAGTKRIDYSPNEFEQRHRYWDKATDIIVNLPLSEVTHYVGLMTESAIKQHQGDIPVRFKGQEALSDKTTKLSFVVFTSDDDKVCNTQDQLSAIEQNLAALAGDIAEVRQFVEDERQPESALGVPDEIPSVPGWPASVISLAEIEGLVAERYNRLPRLLKKAWECIQSSFPP